MPGNVCHGVTIVTARSPAGDLVGLTASSFNPSLSRRPSSCGVSRSSLHGGSSHRSALPSMLADQKEPGPAFCHARRGPRWAGVAHQPGVNNAPAERRRGPFECFNRSRYDEGDHVIFVGEVERCSHRTGAAPLLYHGGRFYTEHPL